jgi:hypothetical protein
VRPSARTVSCSASIAAAAQLARSYLTYATASTEPQLERQTAGYPTVGGRRGSLTALVADDLDGLHHSEGLKCVNEDFLLQVQQRQLNVGVGRRGGGCAAPYVGFEPTSTCFPHTTNKRESVSASDMLPKFALK